MRASKLIPVLAAASALLVLAPAGATASPAAHKHAQGHKHAHLHAKVHANVSGKCRLTEIVEPRTIVSGESVQVFGQLLCTGGGTEGQAVTIYQRPAGGAFKAIGTPTTAAGGFYTLVVPAITTDSRFYARVGKVRSGDRTVKVAPVVTLAGPPENLPLQTGKAHSVTFTGTVTPADEGAEVLLQRENSTANEEWIQIQRGIVGPGGAYTLVHSFALPGTANLRTVVRRHGVFTVRGISNTLSYVINQTQNPNLTIESTADPISFGAPITIHGALKLGEGKTITLLSHPKGSKAFTIVGTTTAKAGGAYEFVQKPAVNTAYRVTGGGVNSAVLFEGVKYLLTAGVSATTVQSGQQLTFSGTVTPGLVGKSVYLERQNAFGGGYHVVDVGKVGTLGTYTIEHFLFGVGKQVFRVKVPGDLANQGIASTPSTIEVTPAPPGALHARKQGKLPQ